MEKGDVETERDIRYQLLFNADDVNWLVENIYIENKNTDALLLTSKQIGLWQPLREASKLFTFREQNSGENHNMKLIINLYKLLQVSVIWEQF